MDKPTRAQKLAACRLYKGELSNPFNGFNAEDIETYVKFHIWDIEDVFVNGDYWECAYRRNHPDPFNDIATAAHDYAVNSKLEKMSCGDEELLSNVLSVYYAL